jgi:predicted flap endonuclease-1-like 5' DNA nuclease
MPHQPESAPADLLIASAPASEPKPLPERTLTAEPEPPASSAETVEPLPNTDAPALPKADSSFEDETQAVDSVEVEEATQAVDSVEVEEVTQAVEPVEADDLEKISGIGPKIAAALRDLGITTFAALASADEKQLQGALEAAGAKRLGDPSFWIKQALYAARGDWDGVRRVVDEHKAQRGNGG